MTASISSSCTVWTVAGNGANSWYSTKNRVKENSPLARSKGYPLPAANMAAEPLCTTHPGYTIVKGHLSWIIWPHLLRVLWEHALVHPSSRPTCPHLHCYFQLAWSLLHSAAGTSRDTKTTDSRHLDFCWFPSDPATCSGHPVVHRDTDTFPRRPPRGRFRYGSAPRHRNASHLDTLPCWRHGSFFPWRHDWNLGTSRFDDRVTHQLAKNHINHITSQWRSAF